MADLQEFAELGAVYLLRQARGARMAGGGKGRRTEGGCQPGIIENNNASNFCVAGTDFPIFPRDFVIMVAVNVNEIPGFRGDELPGRRVGGKGANQLWCRKIEVSEITQSIFVIIDVLLIAGNRIADRGKGRDAADLAGKAVKARQEGGETEGLAAKNADLEKIARVKLAKQKIPQDMESIFTKAAVFSGEVAAMLLQFGRETLMKEAKASEVKSSGVAQTVGPIG